MQREDDLLRESSPAIINGPISKRQVQDPSNDNIASGSNFNRPGLKDDAVAETSKKLWLSTKTVSLDSVSISSAWIFPDVCCSTPIIHTDTTSSVDLLWSTTKQLKSTNIVEFEVDRDWLWCSKCMFEALFNHSERLCFKRSARWVPRRFSCTEL
eukprot:ANDGO_04530.mRNA.1 hypothetical protein